MDFVLHGNPTPRVDQRHLLGSARARPNSGRPSSRINPITGEEIQNVPFKPSIVHSNTPFQSRESVNSRPYNKPKDVPGLDLKYLEENEKKVPIDLYEYCLDTPDSASTISWGSGRSLQHYSHRDTARSVRQISDKNKDVPGLTLEYRAPSVRTKPPSKHKPTAWDKTAVCEDVSPPSAHHRQLYQQYTDEMKLAYKNRHTHPNEDDVKRQIEDVKKSYPLQHKVLADTGSDFVPDNSDAVDTVAENWTKSCYTKSQLLKKMDAESMLDQYKNQKLIETVMIDQLSRAVISDPEQDQRTPNKMYNSRGRGSHRYLHDSKISTRSTATENLLSKRVRFGARILTRNGHDAIRELTGFFFNVDNTLTIYEFKQFGKSAKAIPFINRGTYHHLLGPLKGEAYSLTDIFSGGDIVISTEGHQTLPQSLTSYSVILFRVTNVDEKEKHDLMLQGVTPSDREAVYASLHFTNKEEHENRIIVENIQETVQSLIQKRGVKTITGLGRHYRQLDTTGTGWLDQYDLERGIQKFHIQLDQQSLNILFEILDPENIGGLDYSQYMRSVLGEMKEERKLLVRKAFHKLDAGKKGMINLSDIKKFTNLNSSSYTGETNAIQSFLDNVLHSHKQEEVSYTEFEEYYEGISVGLHSDEDFVNVLRNTWNI